MDFSKLKRILNAFSPLIFFALGIIVAKEMNTKSYSKEFSAKVVVPAVAVTPSGKGMITSIVVQASSGNGRIYMNVYPFSEPDTQQSFYNAIQAAYKVTGVREKLDWKITVKANTTLIGGPSAGLAVAIGASSILLRRKLKPNCTYTGQITADGKVLPVGAVYEKAMAALKNGFHCFIIPKANAVMYYYQPIQKCETIPLLIGVIKRCYTYYERKELNLVEYFKQFNLTIIPVDNLREALKYALE